MTVQAFMTVPTNRWQLSFRRYQLAEYVDGKRPPGGCTTEPDGYHDATRVHGTEERGSPAYDVLVATGGIAAEDLGGGVGYSMGTGPMRDRVWVDENRALWPASCACGYLFTDVDNRMIDFDDLWKRLDTGEELGTMPHRFPPGALYEAPWCDDIWRPQLVHVMSAVLPCGHGWIIDSQASNCTMPEDHRQEQHHCWIIHGSPPRLTVDKMGPTCQAGGGSIMCGQSCYHGFLQDGIFT